MQARIYRPVFTDCRFSTLRGLTSAAYLSSASCLALEPAAMDSQSQAMLCRLELCIPGSMYPTLTMKPTPKNAASFAYHLPPDPGKLTLSWTSDSDGRWLACRQPSRSWASSDLPSSSKLCCRPTTFPVRSGT